MLGARLALEPDPGPRPAAHERRQAPAHPPPAHGGRRPPRRGVAGPGRLPGERAGGARSAVPDHVLARQTVDDCLHEGLSVEGLVDLWAQGRVGRHRRAHGRVVGALALLARHLERAALHVPRRRPARGAPDPRPRRCAAGSASSARTGCPCRPTSWLRWTRRPWPPCSSRCARARATPTSCTTCCSRWWRPGPCPPGRTGSTRWRPTGGRACSTAAGWRPNAPRAAAALVTDDDAAAACVGGHLQLAGPVTVEELVADAPLPAGAPLGAPLSRGPGAHRRWPGSSRRARPSSCPTAAGAPATSSCVCTGPAVAAAAAWSTPFRSPTTCASSPAGSTPRPTPAGGPGRPARRARAAAGDRGAGGGVGGPDPARTGRGLRPALARRALPLGRGGVGPPDAAGRADRAQRHAVAGHAAGLRRCATTS